MKVTKTRVQVEFKSYEEALCFLTAYTIGWVDRRVYAALIKKVSGYQEATCGDGAHPTDLVDAAIDYISKSRSKVD